MKESQNKATTKDSQICEHSKSRSHNIVSLNGKIMKTQIIVQLATYIIANAVAAVPSKHILRSGQATRSAT